MMLRWAVRASTGCHEPHWPCTQRVLRAQGICERTECQGNNWNMLQCVSALLSHTSFDASTLRWAHTHLDLSSAQSCQQGHRSSNTMPNHCSRPLGPHRSLCATIVATFTELMRRVR
jgi:hypothetical protein